MSDKFDTYYADGFEECIIGVCCEGEVPRVVYDKWAMVAVIREADPDLDWDEAVEYLQYNVWGAHMGPGTPMYLRTFSGPTMDKIMEINTFVDEWE